MDREIKFRAFIDGEMIDADSLAFEEYGPLKDQLASVGHLMQFTGLLDKHGKEIYEGDILDKKWGWEVIYFADGFIAKHETPANSRPLHTIIKQRELALVPIETIGNIYEHPGLIGGSDGR